MLPQSTVISDKSFFSKKSHPARQMLDKLSRLLLPKHSSVLPILIHAGEVSDAVEYGDYFARVVDFTDVFEQV